MRNIKKDFPVFKKNPTLVYLDSAATALKPQCVIDAVDEYYREYPANVHRGFYKLSQKATEAYEDARKTVARFLNAKSEREIIFTRGGTEAINIVALGWAKQNLKKDDEILLSVLEHHSNIVPWQLLAKERKLKIKFIDCDKRAVLRTGHLSALLTRRTKLIAITHTSNAVGTIVDLRPIIQKAHAAGAKVLVDAAQAAPHCAIDVQDLDADFLAISGHKMCGPTGIGALYAKEKILKQTEPVFGGGDMILEVSKTRATWNEIPMKFEAGTPPIAEAIGLAAAIKYLQRFGMEAVREHEKSLLVYALKTLAKIPGIAFYGPSDPEIQAGILSFGIKSVHPHDIATILDNENIAVRVGHHCAMPLMKELCVPAGTVRISFYIYNTKADVDRLAEALEKVRKIFNSNKASCTDHLKFKINLGSLSRKHH